MAPDSLTDQMWISLYPLWDLLHRLAHEGEVSLHMLAKSPWSHQSSGRHRKGVQPSHADAASPAGLRSSQLGTE